MTAPRAASVQQTLSILEAMEHPDLFGPFFASSSWDPWRAFLAALFGLPMAAEQIDLYRACTGRTTPPSRPFRECSVPTGRRGGKSRICALVATYLATFQSYAAYLVPGETAVVMVLAVDRAQAKGVFRYVSAFFDQIPALAQLVVHRTKDSIELSTGVAVEIHTSDFRSVRGRTVCALIFDEICFAPTDEAGANPDTEIVAAVRPAMLTIPNALILKPSSPYARRGEMWNDVQRYYGKDDAPVLVWKAPTHVMNPLVDRSIIEQAYADDPASAAAEYGAEFRSDVEAFLSREAVEACVIPGRLEIPRAPRTSYIAFIDPSGGSQDSMTLAIGHLEGEVAVIDALREERPPFKPDDVVKEFSGTLRLYGVSFVTGDAWGGIWVQDQFAKHGISYQLSDLPKSDIYRECLPRILSKRVQLLDHKRLVNQLATLERRVARGGRDSIDHAPSGHDDVANAACGVISRLFGAGVGGGLGLLEWYRREADKLTAQSAV